MRNPKHQKPNPRRWSSKILWAPLGFPEAITLAYDLFLAIIIPCFEDFEEAQRAGLKQTCVPIWHFPSLSIFPKNIF